MTARCILPAVLILVTGLAASAEPAARTPEQVVQHHSAAMATHRIADILRDYADAAVLIDPSGVTRGKEAIGRSIGHVLGSSTFVASPPNHVVYSGEIAYLTWQPAPGKGNRPLSETYVIRHGLIVAQTVTFAPASP